MDFDLAFTPVTNSYPNAATGQYPVQSGDTLESIALSAYGDSSLWYLIADANGLSGDGDLRVGQIINIPTKVNGVHNNASTVTPYDASKIVGSTTPSLPAPQPKHGCGVIGMIIMVVVAVVATVLTAGAAAAALAAAAPALFAGAAVTVGVTSVSLAGALVAGAIAGAVGSIASQLVGMAIHQTSGFSWKQVGMAAIGGGVTAGLGGMDYSALLTSAPTAATDAVSDTGVDVATTVGTTGATTASSSSVSTMLLNTAKTVGTAAGEAALTSAGEQELGVRLGLQKNFSWREVAGAAVGAGASAAVGSLLSSTPEFKNPSTWSDFAERDAMQSASKSFGVRWLAWISV